MENFKIDVDSDGIALITFDVPGRSMNTITGSVMRDLMEALGQDPNSFEGGSNPMNRVGRDPLGRPQAGLGNTDNERVAIPEESEIQRTREILRELYRRAGDRTRSQTENDYIERLLRRF